MTSAIFDSVLESSFNELRAVELRTALGKLDDLERALDVLEGELEEILVWHKTNPVIHR